MSIMHTSNTTATAKVNLSCSGTRTLKEAFPSPMCCSVILESANSQQNCRLQAL